MNNTNQFSTPHKDILLHSSRLPWAGQMKSVKGIKGRRNEELPELVLMGVLHRARMKCKTQRLRQMRNYIPKEVMQPGSCAMSLAGSPLPLRKCEVCAVQTKATHCKHSSITLARERERLVFTFQRSPCLMLEEGNVFHTLKT